MRVFPLNDDNMGTAHFNFDNQGWLFVNENLVGSSTCVAAESCRKQTTSTGVGAASVMDSGTFEFQADCSEPTVYSIHIVDFETSELGTTVSISLLTRH
jgi:hypothetical protein